MEAKDLYTGIVFKKLRNNQKFSTRANQVAYNNMIAQKKRAAKAFVDKVLDRNRSILKHILGVVTEVTKSRDYLLGAGFNLNCSTHRIDRDGVIYTCVYEYALSLIHISEPTRPY